MSVFMETSIKTFWDEEKGRTECAQREWGEMWKPSTTKMKSQVDRKGWGGVRPRKGRWNGPGKDRRERAYCVWEVLRVRVRGVKDHHLHAGAKTPEDLNSKRSE